MTINLKHSQTGVLKKAPTGFSFTTFFFGMFVHAFRGHWTPAFVTWLTAGLAGIYYCFAGNKGYIAHLMEKGYIAADDEAYDKLVEMGLAEAKKSEEINLIAA